MSVCNSFTRCCTCARLVACSSSSCCSISRAVNVALSPEASMLLRMHHRRSVAIGRLPAPPGCNIVTVGEDGSGNLHVGHCSCCAHLLHLDFRRLRASWIVIYVCPFFNAGHNTLVWKHSSLLSGCITIWLSLAAFSSFVQYTHIGQGNMCLSPTSSAVAVPEPSSSAGHVSS